MNLLKKLFRNKTAPEETMVPDDLIPHYLEPSEKLQTILQRVPGTGKMFYKYIRQHGISKEWKYWAVDMMENGLETPGIVQLAGEDLNMNPFAFANLLDTVFQELDIQVSPEIAYSSYVMSIAGEVLHGERTARSGFEVLSRAAIENDYHKILYVFYLWLDNADEVAFYTVKGSGLRVDNVDKWMHQFFEKLVKANNKYFSK